MAKKHNNNLLEPNELSIEKLRKYKGLENVNDEYAENAVLVLKEFSILAYRIFEQFNKIEDG